MSDSLLFEKKLLNELETGDLFAHYSPFRFDIDKDGTVNPSRDLTDQLLYELLPDGNCFCKRIEMSTHKSQFITYMGFVWKVIPVAKENVEVIDE